MLEKIQNLSIDPRPNGYIKLKGSDVCRIRLGNYRVIYRILDEILIIDVINLGHRKDIYN
jgi:mRNA interferase RelE/StbE